MQEPVVLLCDEPIASLDPSSSKIVMDYIRQFSKQRGIACIVNLHQVDVALEYADRIIGLLDGRIYFDGSPKDLTTAIIEEIYETTIDKLIIHTGEASE